MLDIKFVRENPDIVKENIKKKFQDHKIPMVDEVIKLDEEARKVQQEADSLRADRNKLSKQIGALMGQGKKEEAEEVKKQVGLNSARLAELEEKETELQAKVKKIMMVIPNIIDPSVPIGKNNVTPEVIRILSTKLSLSEKQTCLKEATESTDWVYDTIRQICGGNIL